MRTPLASGLTALAFVFVLLGLGFRSWQLVLLALPPLAFLATAALVPPVVPVIRATRTLSRDRIEAGQAFEASVLVVNDGPGLDLVEIRDCVLTPGDPSPAGRCPDCEALAYLDDSEAHPVEGAIEHVLDLSTAHMPSGTPDWGKLRVAEHEYGFVVFVNGGLAEDEVEDIEPEWTRPIMRLAREYDCLLVHFDQSADVVDDLPVWKW